MIRRVLYGCWFGGHQDLIWTANVLTCLQCGTVIPVLPGETITGPAHAQQPIRGVPKMQAKKVRVDNVREWKRSER